MVESRIPYKAHVAQARYWLNEFPAVASFFPLSKSIKREVLSEYQRKEPSFTQRHLLEALNIHLNSDEYIRRTSRQTGRYSLHGRPVKAAKSCLA